MSELQRQLLIHKHSIFNGIETKWMWLSCVDKTPLNEIIMEIKDDVKSSIEKIRLNSHGIFECFDEDCYMCTENLLDIKCYLQTYELIYDFVCHTISLHDFCDELMNLGLKHYLISLWGELPDDLKLEYGHLMKHGVSTEEEEEEDDDDDADDKNYELYF